MRCSWDEESQQDFRQLCDLLQAAGVESSELIVMATQNGGKAMGREDVGVLKQNARADLIVVAGNPLEDISNLRKLTHVMRAGTLHALSDLVGR